MHARGSRISKYHRTNNRELYCRQYFQLRDNFWKTFPWEEMSVVELFALHSGPLKSNELSIFSRIIKTKYKLLRKSLLRYSLSYLPTTPPPSVIFFIKAIPGGGFFYCSIALYPDRQPVDQATRKSTWNRWSRRVTLHIANLHIANSFKNRDNFVISTLAAGREKQ